MFMPSVSYSMVSEKVGYLRIACFQDTTLQELDLARVVDVVERDSGDLSQGRPAACRRKGPRQEIVGQALDDGAQ